MYWHEVDEQSTRRRGERRVSAPYPPRAEELWPQFDQYLSDRGLDPALARVNNWYPSTSAGDAVPRIVIPCTNSAGAGYWQARAMQVTDKRYQSPSVTRGDSVVVVWPTGDPRAVVVVEGPMDALAAAGEGCLGVALMGNTPPARVLNFVSTLASSLPVLVVGDSDALREASHTAGALAIRGRKTQLVMLQGAKDLAELTPALRKNYLG